MGNFLLILHVDFSACFQKRKRSFRKSSFGYFPFKESNAPPGEGDGNAPIFL